MKRPPSPATTNNNDNTEDPPNTIFPRIVKMKRCKESQHSCWPEPSWKQLPKEDPSTEEDRILIGSPTSSHHDFDVDKTTALLPQLTNNIPITTTTTTTTTIKSRANHREDAPTSNSSSMVPPTKEKETAPLHVISSSSSSSWLSNADTNSSSSITPSPSTSTSPLTIESPSELPNENRLTNHNTTTSSTTATTTPTSHYNRTALVFETGKHHYDCHNKYHKERPLRIEAVLDFLSRQDCPIPNQCQYFNTPLPSCLDQNILLEQVHVPGYIQRLQHLSSNPATNQERWDQEAQQYKSIYLTQHSFQEALKAATTLCGLVEHVVKKQCAEEDDDHATTTDHTPTLLDNGFAIIRPPGHHAEPGFAGGYCVLNNIALAATYIQQKYASHIRKIMILDWDIHHGNGTQQIFYDNPNVLVISIHRWHGGHYYPFQKSGGPSHVGTGKGKGRNVNVAWNRKGLGDTEYHYVFQHLVMPMAKEFQPDLILVSAGFDAAHGDDVGECHLSTNAFGQFTRACMSIQSKVVCALEGGYKRSVLSCCVEEVVKALLDKDSPRKHDQEWRDFARSTNTIVHPSAMKSIRATMEAHQPYWKCLQKP